MTDANDLYQEPGGLEALMAGIEAVRKQPPETDHPDLGRVGAKGETCGMAYIGVECHDDQKYNTPNAFTQLINDIPDDILLTGEADEQQPPPPGEPPPWLNAPPITGQAAKQQGFGLVHALAGDDEPPDWITDNFLTADSLAVIFGESGCGKSLLAIDLAASIATGKPFYERHTRPGAVIYLAGEGQRGLRRRFAAWENYHQISLVNAPLFRSTMAAPLSDPASLVEVEKAIDEVKAANGPLRLIVIDTLARHYNGDENSTADMGTFIAALDALRCRYGAAVLTVHHTGHGAKERGRGSSSLRAALDFEYKLDLADDVRNLICTKCKDFEKPQTMSFRLEIVDTANKAEGTFFSSAVLVPTDYQPPPKTTSAGKGKNQTKGLDILKALFAHHRANLETGGHPDGVARVTVEEWASKCASQGIQRRRFLEVKTALETQGVITVKSGYIALTD